MLSKLARPVVAAPVRFGHYFTETTARFWRDTSFFVGTVFVIGAILNCDKRIAVNPYETKVDTKAFHELLGNGNGRKTKMPFSSGMKSGFHNDHFNAAGPGYVDGDNEYDLYPHPGFFWRSFEGSFPGPRPGAGVFDPEYRAQHQIGDAEFEYILEKHFHGRYDKQGNRLHPLSH
ncbi:Oidioi.mRNA.OKI2018_I69.chr1.g2399.t1.cds [Oikopleura dioica]|uniref:Oidioi.mRNA.OKI2018_I69.chr1.g2399.t1.cds n=1 Tax=Oikopleura dioica TaxID=34765 RepID=A0ABN7SUW1_OIKDI|nr:Oidioi.mRNA.OKI2018_I69.chr1.g2399.t1.cds [Oikopleura dioica]